MAQWLRKPLVASLLLFVVAAGVRLIYGLVLESYPGPGYGREMERAAATLARDGEMKDVFGPNSGPTAHVAPAYVYLLAGAYRLFGHQDVNGWRAQVVLGVLATSLLIALIPIIARRAGLRPSAGNVAGIVLALSPCNLWVETSGAWEQPYAALALVALLAAFLALHDRQWQSPGLVLATGLLLGGTALLSPAVAVPAVGLMIVGELLLQVGRRRQVLIGTAVIGLVAAACLGPWTWRNYQVLGGLVPLRSNFGLELYMGNNPHANGKTYPTRADDPELVSRTWHPGCSREQLARVREIGELAYMKERQHQAMAWIAANPERFIDLNVKRAELYWCPPASLWYPPSPGQSFKAMVYTLTGIGTFVALGLLWWTRHSYRWLLLGCAVGPSLIYLVTHVETRYRYPTFALSVLLTCEVCCYASAVLWNQFAFRGILGRLRLVQSQ